MNCLFRLRAARTDSGLLTRCTRRHGRDDSRKGGRLVWRGVAASGGQPHAESVDVSRKLQLKPGQSVAVLNPPPGLVLPGVVAAVTAADADAVVAFVVRRDDLGSAEQAVAAARADRLAWIGYPKGGQLGTDLNRDRLAAALVGHGVQPVRQVSIDGTWSALRFRPAEQ
jgi:hypothetical protein